MNCSDAYGELFRKLIAAEITPEERSSLDEHTRSCAECRQFLGVHRQLEELAGEIPMPNEADFALMRGGVLARLPRERAADTGAGYWQRALGAIRLRPVAAAALVLAMLGAAFLGRWSAGGASLDGALFLRAIEAQAQSSPGLAGYGEAPLSYTNVLARQLDGERVAFSFDVSRHMELVTHRDTGVARDILVHAIFDPSSVGKRLKAMEISESIFDDQLKQTLLLTLRNDPVLAIRLKALKAIQRHPFDVQIQEALLETLRQDVAVQMRTLALELLASEQVGASLLRRAITDIDLEGDAAVLLRAAEISRRL